MKEQEKIFSTALHKNRCVLTCGVLVTVYECDPTRLEATELHTEQATLSATMTSTNLLHNN